MAFLKAKMWAYHRCSCVSIVWCMQLRRLDKQHYADTNTSEYTNRDRQLVQVISHLAMAFSEWHGMKKRGTNAERFQFYKGS